MAVRPGIGISFVPKEHKGNVHIVLELYQGSNFLPETGQTQALVDQILSEYPDYCALANASSDIDYQGTFMPAAWLATILPEIEMPKLATYVSGDCCTEDYPADEYPPGKGPISAIYYKGMILVRFNSDRHYSQAYHKLHTYLMESLKYLYQSGSVVLDSDDNPVIENWSLVRRRNKIYSPDWDNAIFAPDRVQFLWSRLAGHKSIKVKIGSNNVVRHYLSLELLGHNYSYFGPYILFEVENKNQAQVLVHKVLSILGKVNGRVQVTNLQRENPKGLVCYDIVQGYLESSLD